MQRNDEVNRTKHVHDGEQRQQRNTEKEKIVTFARKKNSHNDVSEIDEI